MKYRKLNHSEIISRMSELQNFTTKYYKQTDVDFRKMHVFIAESPNFFRKEKILTGIACLKNYHGYWFCRLCVVRPEFRGLGIQSKLLQQRINYVRSRGGNRIGVWIDPTNCYSLNNAIENGFRFEGKELRVFDGKEHQKLIRYL